MSGYGTFPSEEWLAQPTAHGYDGGDDRYTEYDPRAAAQARAAELHADMELQAETSQQAAARARAELLASVGLQADGPRRIVRARRTVPAHEVCPLPTEQPPYVPGAYGSADVNASAAARTAAAAAAAAAEYEAGCAVFQQRLIATAARASVPTFVSGDAHFDDDSGLPSPGGDGSVRFEIEAQVADMLE